MTSPRAGTCIFCDDVRHEIGGKTSIIGMYAGDMIFPNPAPAMLPKFCCVVFVMADVNDKPTKLTLRVIAPSEKPEGIELAKIDMPSDMPVENEDGAIKITMRMIVEMGPVALTQSGYFEVWADTEREKIRCGRLKVIFPIAVAADQTQKKT